VNLLSHLESEMGTAISCSFSDDAVIVTLLGLIWPLSRELTALETRLSINGVSYLKRKSIPANEFGGDESAN
jgi:hypothetical protein